jgi:hypothetical protein
MEALERANAYLAAELAKLKGTPSRMPVLPHTPRAEVPQFLGMPAGLGRHGVTGPAGANGGVRLVSRVVGVEAPAAEQTGFTRRPHPLNVITGPGPR